MWFWSLLLIKWMSIFVSINTDAPLRNYASALKNMPTGDGNADKTLDWENPGGDDARPAIPWRTVPHLLAGGGEIFWIIHQRDDYRYGAHSGGVVFLHGGVNKIKRDGNGIA